MRLPVIDVVANGGQTFDFIVFKYEVQYRAGVGLDKSLSLSPFTSSLVSNHFSQKQKRGSGKHNQSETSKPIRVNRESFDQFFVYR
jgi:hypothetical protein